jgi:hypothetical protein|tara:strand:+ start:142 stop:978 length:837 start_codon:yes stop_codon:yes gene_type:complete
MIKTFHKISLFLGIISFAPMLFYNIASITKTEDSVQHGIKPVPENVIEIYDSNIAGITDLNNLKQLVKKEIEEKNYSGIEIPILVDDIVRRKYFHSTAYIQNETNWILKIADTFFPEKVFLSAMKPKDLIKFNHAICNQQAIIFQDIIKDLGFEFASIGFDIRTKNKNIGHFVSAVKVNQDWFYFDSNMEPKYNRKDSSVFLRILDGDKNIFKKLYPEFDLEYLTEDMITFRDLNKFPARKGVFFQNITWIFSNYLWLIFILIAFNIRYFNKTKMKGN